MAEKKEVKDAYSTQECSSCHAHKRFRVNFSVRLLLFDQCAAIMLRNNFPVSAYRPKGLACLRKWTCSACQSEHDRDTNAAQNILARGLLELEKEFSTAGEAKADEAAVNKDGQPSQVRNDLPVARIITPSGR